MLAKTGANRIITMDLPSKQIQRFFDIPFDAINVMSLFINYIKKYFVSPIIVAPDQGRSKI